MSRGFSLIQLSLLLMVMSLTLVACLPAARNNEVSANETTIRMNTILLALRQFETSNGRLPCPADASQPIGSAAYGVEAANPGASGNCSGGSPAANYTDASHHVATGMVPLRALGLSNSYAVDSWGRTITYAVDTNATICFEGTLTGALAIGDNGTNVNSVVALISHGPDGHGAWIPQPGTAGSAVRLNSVSGDAGELLNAHVDAGFNPTLPLTNYIRQSPTSTFGDLVAYHNPSWNLNSMTASASNLFPTLTAPAAGTYIAGEPLTFTLTYPQPVTVTGTPRLDLLLGSVARYATYVAGSGTNLLTFRYTLQNGDYSPAGISVTQSVDSNGATLSSACNSFTQPPGMASIAVKNLYVYVTDALNERVQLFNASGVYQNKFGTAGVLNGQFLTPNQPAVDASGNVWVSDWVNARVQEFSPGGAYENKFGSLGVLNGQFTTAGSMAIDNSGNFWVADVGGNRIEKFNSSGSYLGQLGSAGVLNGQFLVPTGIALDAAGDVWVGDFGNSRVEEFSANGSYVNKLGSLGSGNGQFVNPCGVAIDPTGNIWVVDQGNNRVEEFSSGGAYLRQFGTSGTGNGQFNAPCGISADLAGNLWIVDVGNNRIEEFAPNGAYLMQFGTLGSGNGQFNVPSGIGLGYY